MRSFQKSFITPAINGTKIKNNLPHTSTGIPSLDHVIGGGLPAGSVFAVEEDVLGNYSRVMIKYFLAEGVVNKHGLFVASGEENPKNIVKELPTPCVAPPEDTDTLTGEVEKMNIAWRYNQLKQVESSFGSTALSGHYFDLTKQMDEETVKSTDISYCDLTVNCHELATKGFKNGLYHKLLTSIKRVLSKEEYRNEGCKNSNILRISIQSLGSPLWMSLDCGDEWEVGYGHELMKFMYCLRILLRDTNAIAFVTIPAHLFDDEHIIKRLLYSVDNAVKIESFAGSSRETNPLYKDYHGLLHITKLTSLYSMVQFVPPSLDLAFKLKRKKFLIEKLHLPPELEDSSEREQDDITATPSVNCGGYKKKDIDF